MNLLIGFGKLLTIVLPHPETMTSEPPSAGILCLGRAIGWMKLEKIISLAVRINEISLISSSSFHSLCGVILSKFIFVPPERRFVVPITAYMLAGSVHSLAVQWAAVNKNRLFKIDAPHKSLPSAVEYSTAWYGNCPSVAFFPFTIRGSYINLAVATTIQIAKMKTTITLAEVMLEFWHQTNRVRS